MNATSAPFRAGPRLLVDQADAARSQVRQRCFDIVDAERHVMHARGRASPRTSRSANPPPSPRAFPRSTGRCSGRSARTRCDAISSLASTCRPSTSLKNARDACRSLDRDPDVIEDGFHRSWLSARWPVAVGLSNACRKNIRGRRIRIDFPSGNAIDQSLRTRQAPSSPCSTCSMKRWVRRSRRRNSLRALSRLARVPSDCVRNAWIVCHSSARPCRSWPRSSRSADATRLRQSAAGRGSIRSTSPCDRRRRDRTC